MLTFTKKKSYTRKRNYNFNAWKLLKCTKLQGARKQSTKKYTKYPKYILPLIKLGTWNSSPIKVPFLKNYKLLTKIRGPLSNKTAMCMYFIFGKMLEATSRWTLLRLSIVRRLKKELTWMVTGIGHDRFLNTDRLLAVPSISGHAVPRVRSLQPVTSSTSYMTSSSNRIIHRPGRMTRTSDLQ